MIPENKLNVNYVIPHPFNSRVSPHVAMAVAKAAIETGSARLFIDPKKIKERTEKLTPRDHAVASYYSWYFKMIE